ncbi:MAG: hypothetical protein JRM80_03085 [Nitrososphaerota archaeon]|nr:hypothetical protein [Nitrososphaerota archaeon]
MAEQLGAKAVAGRGRVSILVVVAVVLVGFAAVTLSGAQPRATSSTSTRFSTGADSVVSAAAGQDAAGYSLQSSDPNPNASGDWAVLGAADGSRANMTALVFSSQDDSQAYFGRLVSNLKGLPGYTDITPSIAQFQQYGSCYGHGEYVDSISVADGVCTKGNVFLQVHLVSGKPLDELEVDMTDLMGALCQSVA